MDKSWARYAGMGMEVAAGVGVGLFVGYWLNNRFGWSLAPLIGMFVGMIAGTYLLIKQAVEIGRSEDKEKKSK